MAQGVPSASKLLTRKWRQDDVDRHYMRLHNTKPIISSHNPNDLSNYPFLTNKPKQKMKNEGNRWTYFNFLWIQKEELRLRKTIWSCSTRCGKSFRLVGKLGVPTIQVSTFERLTVQLDWNWLQELRLPLWNLIEVVADKTAREHAEEQNPTQHN